MRHAVLILCGLASTVPALAAVEPDPCKRNRDLLLQEATKYDCPQEEAEGRAISCTRTGMDAIKDVRRLAELVTSCHTRPKKGGASSSSTATAGPPSSPSTSSSSSAVSSSSRSCTAQARYVEAAAGDAHGFKQALTFAVSANRAAHGLISYTMHFTDNSGSPLTETSNEQYKFVPGGGSNTADDVYLSLNGYTVTGVTVNEVTCYKEPSGRCTASATYVGDAPGTAKGKALLSFSVAAGDCGPSCHGHIKYTLAWKDKNGAAKEQSGIHSYELVGGGSGGGGGASEVLLVDNTNLEPSCTKTNPCKLTGVTIDKVSCFAD